MLLVREERSAATGNAVSDVVSGFSRTTRDPPPALPGELTSFFWVLTLFTLGSSTDAFLLLKRTNVAGS